MGFRKFNPVRAPCYDPSPPLDHNFAYVTKRMLMKELTLTFEVQYVRWLKFEYPLLVCAPNPHRSRRYRVLYDRSDPFAGQLSHAESLKACDRRGGRDKVNRYMLVLIQGFACSLLNVLRVDMHLHIPYSYCFRQ